MPIERKNLCIVCGSKYHYQTFCPYKKKKPISKQGKVYNLWKETRLLWFKENKPPYFCYLCNKPLKKEQVTLDHVIPRGSYPQFRYNLDNLKPACIKCNNEKASQSLENYLKNKKSIDK